MRLFHSSQKTSSNSAKPAQDAQAFESAPHLSTPVSYLVNTLLIVIVIALGQFLIASAFISRYQISVLEQIGIYIIMAVSLNLVTGYLGQLPLGHAGFMSVGGYAGAIFIMKCAEALHLAPRAFVLLSPVAVAIFIGGVVIGGLAAALCGLIIGIPALRLKGDYLAIITLGFAEIIRVVMQNFDDTFNVTLTGGSKGLTGIPSFTNFINTSVLVVITIFVIHTLMKSRWGRAIYAIRDNEIAAEASGISITMYKTTAFVLSAFFAGVAGVLYAGCIGVLAPAKFGFMKSVEILVMVVLGGMGSMLGSILSATTLTVLPELLRGFSDYRMIAYSVVLILVMIFRPKGLFGSYDFSLSRIFGKLMLKVRGTSNKKEVSAHE